MGLYRLHTKSAARAKTKSLNHVSLNRLFALGSLFIFGIILILARSFYIQIIGRGPWIEKAGLQYEKRVPLPAERGLIYDRHMDVLAMDLPLYHLAFDHKLIDNEQQVTGKLAKILGGQKKTYLDLFQRATGKRFAYIRRELTDNQRQKILDAKIPGLIVEKKQRRIRPYGVLGRQVIGVLDSRLKAIGGVEQAWDQSLRGEDGWAIYQKDAYNQSFPSLEFPAEPPTDGDNLVLTLDQTFQTILEEELQNGLKTYKAQDGCAVMMNPYTGEILGMASVWAGRSEADTLNYEEYVENRTVQWDFEPGSTFKIVTAAAALEENLFNSNTLIYCEKGAIKIGSRVIRDHNEKYEWLTFSEVIELSSNIGVVKIAKKLGKEKLYQYIRNFGFGTPAGIDLPREVSGILPPVYQWNEFSAATIAFGQGLSSSALQQACMLSVIANGGELVQPFLKQSILRRDGSADKSTRPKVIRRVISEETAAQMRVILEKVVSEGNGKLASVERISVAGKTGTAEKSAKGIKGYAPGIHVSSFVGFWPADIPKYVLVVVLDEPREQYWASKSAAPIFSRIVERIVGLPETPRYFEVEPSQKSKDKTLASLVFPIPGGRKSDGDKKTSAPVETRIVSKYHVPNLSGLSMREAMKLCGETGIAVEAEGSGRVISQDPKAGTRIHSGLVCRIKCEQGNWQ